jgi:hypothetical protein
MPDPTVPLVYVLAEDDETISREWAAKAITGRPVLTILAATSASPAGRRSSRRCSTRSRRNS